MTSPEWRRIESALEERTPVRVEGPVSSRAAVALILRQGAAGLDLLVIRRAEHPYDPWSGQIGFPGGRWEEGDADLHATAIRETKEEIGIDLATAATYLGALDEVRAMARMRPMDLAISPFVFRLERDAAPVLSDEVGSVHWVPMDALARPASRSTMEYIHQGVALEFPCIRFEELVIWGLTYRMLTGFQQLLLPPEEPR